jgi:hypothetical protein
MLEKLEVVSQLFHGFAYEDYFAADTAQKLSLILSAEDHILGLEDGKKRFINEVRFTRAIACIRLCPFIGLSIYSVCKLGASKPVSHISRTITNLSLK